MRVYGRSTLPRPRPFDQDEGNAVLYAARLVWESLSDQARTHAIKGETSYTAVPAYAMRALAQAVDPSYSDQADPDEED